MQFELANRQALRFALGVAPVFILSQGIGWPIGFVGALFTAMILQMPMPLPLGAALKTLAVAFVLNAGGSSPWPASWRLPFGAIWRTA